MTLINKMSVTVINGNLLASPEQFIAHQCNCVTKKGRGLAKSMFAAFPEANAYSSRTAPSIPGTIDVKGKVINMFAQYSPGKNVDELNNREEWFIKCLGKIAVIAEELLIFSIEFIL
jgi:O-acetyl-ADP-ribose deacetylase (regulator of RNase III)